MDRLFWPVEHEEMQATLLLLGDQPIAGVVSCSMRARDPEGLDARLTQLGFETQPEKTAAQCELYLPTHRESVLGTFDSDLPGSNEELLAENWPEDWQGHIQAD